MSSWSASRISADEALEATIPAVVGNDGYRGAVGFHANLDVSVEVSDVEEFLEVVSCNVTLAIKLAGVVFSHNKSFECWCADVIKS